MSNILQSILWNKGNKTVADNHPSNIEEAKDSKENRRTWTVWEKLLKADQPSNPAKPQSVKPLLLTKTIWTSLKEKWNINNRWDCIDLYLDSESKELFYQSKIQINSEGQEKC